MAYGQRLVQPWHPLHLLHTSQLYPASWLRTKHICARHGLMCSHCLPCILPPSICAAFGPQTVGTATAWTTAPDKCRCDTQRLLLQEPNTELVAGCHICGVCTIGGWEGGLALLSNLERSPLTKIMLRGLPAQGGFEAAYYGMNLFAAGVSIMLLANGWRAML